MSETQCETKTVSTNGNCKLFWGLERKYKHETKPAKIKSIKFLTAHILQRGKGLQLTTKGENGRCENLCD